METKPIYAKKNQRILVRFCTRYNNLLAYYDEINSNFHGNSSIRQILARLEQNSQKTTKNLKSWIDTLNAGYLSCSVHNFSYLLEYTDQDFAYLDSLGAKMLDYLEAHKQVEKTKTVSFQTFNLLV